MAPALVGAAFSANYDGQTVGDLFDRNRTTMPVGQGRAVERRSRTPTSRRSCCSSTSFPAGATELPSAGHDAQVRSSTLAPSRPRARPQQGSTGRPARIRTTPTAREWIKRLERPDRIPGLKIDEVIASLDLKPGDVVADIGAGTGAFTIPFAKAVAPSGTAFAVDIWPELLDYVEAEGEAGGRRARCRRYWPRATIRKLPPKQVDVAFFHDVFHNVNDRQAYLKRARVAT